MSYPKKKGGQDGQKEVIVGNGKLNSLDKGKQKSLQLGKQNSLFRTSPVLLRKHYRSGNDKKQNVQTDP